MCHAHTCVSCTHVMHTRTHACPRVTHMHIHTSRCGSSWIETEWSLIAHNQESKQSPNLLIWWKYLKLRGIMVNKGRIYREIRYFWEIFWNLIKLDDELVIEIRKNGRFKKITQRRIHEIKNHSIYISIHGESKSEVERNFWKLEERKTKIKD